MESSKSALYQTAKKIWSTVTKADSQYSEEVELQIDKHKQLLNLFQVGNYYYLVFNIYQGEIEFFSENVKNVLGYEQDELTITSYLDKIHPDDKNYFLNFEHRITEFFIGLPFDKISKYKVQYDFRIKAKNNQYVRILQQGIQIDYDEKNYYRTLGIQTDISHIKKEGIPGFSIIGIDGEPSYFNIQNEEIYKKSYDLFTKREREILRLIISGKSTAEIANELHISTHTVSTHRKNILLKTNCKTPGNLIATVINEGYI